LEKPKITILLAACNREKLISETLDSIISQTYSNWECFVTDDRSTDGTAARVKEYCRKDSRFQYYLKPEKYPDGLSGTRNFGLDLAEQADAKYVQFFDDDDLMHPKKMELQLNVLLENPKLYFSVCHYEKLIMKSSGEEIKQMPEFPSHFSHFGDSILTGEFKMNSLGPLWNMEFLKHYRFDERLKYAEEWELYVRMGYQHPSPSNYIILNDYLFTYRKHSKTLTLSKDENFEKVRASAICNHSLCDYLISKRLHTNISIKHFAKIFSVLDYNPRYLQKLYAYIQRERFPLFSRLFLKILIQTGKINYKIGGKISTWI
jgi:GalNAc5-diNAcBac-PP-undecaprenol beta-1,3-glucosyltransferase